MTSHRHTIILHNAIGFAAEDKAAVHMVTFIKPDAPEYCCPSLDAPILFYQIIVDRLFFPFRMFLNKLRIDVLGVVLELCIKQKCSADIERRHHPCK